MYITEFSQKWGGCITAPQSVLGGGAWPPAPTPVADPMYESHRGQKSLFTIYYFIVECEKLFCKTNIKLKVLKLNKTKLKYKNRYYIIWEKRVYYYIISEKTTYIIFFLNYIESISNKIKLYQFSGTDQD